MWLTYKKTREIFWDAKANKIFSDLWITKTTPWRIAKPKKELTEKEYIKLSEYEHWKMFASYLKDNHSDIEFTHIWNESWQSWTKNIVIMMAKKKALWVSSWFPDYILQIPTIDNHYYTLYIELKKAKWPQWWWNGSSLSEEQAVWLNTLQNSAMSFCEIWHWSKDSISILNKYLIEYKNDNIDTILEKWKTKVKRDFRLLVTTTK